MTARTNSISALGGFPVHDDPEADGGDALQGFATGNRTGKPAAREQEVLTPQGVIDVCREVWPEGIALDPCDDSSLPWYEDWQELSSLPHPGPPPERRLSLVGADQVYTSLDGGLDLPWVARTFVNPPYRDLRDYLAVASAAPDELIFLGPVRTHRRWWRTHLREYDSVAWLDPLRFLGFASGFPAPLFLAYRGSRVPAFEAAVVRLGLGDVGEFR